MSPLDDVQAIRKARRAKRDAQYEKEERERQARKDVHRARRGSPQRFTLSGLKIHRSSDGDSMGIPESIDPPLEQNEKVRVREDIITTEDVDAIAICLARLDLGTYVGQNDQRARELLALVLGSDKEGENA